MVQIDKRLAEHYFLTPGKPRPNGTTAHKSHIPQVMLFSAIARFHWDARRNQWFNGKIGLHPIADHGPAAQASRNRPARTLEWKNKKLTAALYVQYIFECVVPAIMQKWPTRGGNISIQIQEDNAPLIFHQKSSKKNGLR
jgi:hypothetical protein